MASDGEWRSGCKQQQMAQKWALPATAATIIGVLRDMCGEQKSAVCSAPTRYSPHPVEHPGCNTALTHKTLPPEGLAIMVIIVAAAQGTHQQDTRCVHADNAARATASAQPDRGPEPPRDVSHTTPRSSQDHRDPRGAADYAALGDVR